MLTIPVSVRIFIGSTPIDMRKSIDSLMAIVQDELREDAYSGHLFVFVSRRCDRVKVLTWDKGGFVLLYKRLSAASSSSRTWTHRRWRSRSTPPSSRCCSTGSTSAVCAGPSAGHPHPRWIDRGLVPWTSQLRRDLPSLMGGDDHRCAWRDQAESLRVQLAVANARLVELEAARATIAAQQSAMSQLTEQLGSVQATVEKLQRHVFGP